jgi:hypothetical protein
MTMTRNLLTNNANVDPHELKSNRIRFLHTVVAEIPDLLDSLFDLHLHDPPPDSKEYTFDAITFDNWAYNHKLLLSDHDWGGDPDVYWIVSAFRETVLYWRDNPQCAKTRQLPPPSAFHSLNWVSRQFSSCVFVVSRNNRVFGSKIECTDCMKQELKDSIQRELERGDINHAWEITQLCVAAQLPWDARDSTDSIRDRLVSELDAQLKEQVKMYDSVESTTRAHLGPYINQFVFVTRGWDENVETWDQFSARLSRELSEQLTRIKETVLSHTTHPKTYNNDHYKWLVYYHFLGKTFSELKREFNISRTAITAAVEKVAKQLFLQHWRSWLRKPSGGGRPRTKEDTCEATESPPAISTSTQRKPHARRGRRR